MLAPKKSISHDDDAGFWKRMRRLAKAAIAMIMALFSFLFRPLRALVRGSAWCGKQAVNGSVAVVNTGFRAVQGILAAPAYGYALGKSGGVNAQASQALDGARQDIRDIKGQVEKKLSKPTRLVPEAVAADYAQAVVDGTERPDTVGVPLRIRVWLAGLTPEAAKKVLALKPEILAAHIAGAQRIAGLPELPPMDPRVFDRGTRSSPPRKRRRRDEEDEDFDFEPPVPRPAW